MIRWDPVARHCCNVARFLVALSLVDEHDLVFKTCTRVVACDECGRTAPVTYRAHGVTAKTLRLLVTPTRLHLAKCARAPATARATRSRLAPLFAAAARDDAAPQPAACCLGPAWRAYVGVRP